jgi:hypothetical protein
MYQFELIAAFQTEALARFSLKTIFQLKFITFATQSQALRLTTLLYAL